MTPPPDFCTTLTGFRSGDAVASTELFTRYVRQLTALASRQFDSAVRERADPEGVVQSVYRSFFTRDMRRNFQLDDWESLWKLLATITVRKCSKKRRLRSLANKPGRQVSAFGGTDKEGGSWFEAIDGGPTPLQATELAETMSLLFNELNLEDRRIAERILVGETAVEIANRHECSEKRVHRLRARLRERLEQIVSELHAD